jgi:hypothetical protein
MGYEFSHVSKRTDLPEKLDSNPLTPELNPSAQRCLMRVLLAIFLLELCISLMYL